MNRYLIGLCFVAGLWFFVPCSANSAKIGDVLRKTRTTYWFDFSIFGGINYEPHNNKFSFYPKLRVGGSLLSFSPFYRQVFSTGLTLGLYQLNDVQVGGYFEWLSISWGIHSSIEIGYSSSSVFTRFSVGWSLVSFDMNIQFSSNNTSIDFGCSFRIPLSFVFLRIFNKH